MEQTDLTQEAVDTIEDRIDELQSVLDRLGDGRDDPAEGIEEVRRLIHSVKGIGSSFGIVVIRVLAHRFEDYLEGSDRLEGDLLDNCQVFLDRLSEAVEEHISAGPDEIAKLVRKLPAKGGFDVTDIEVHDIEVMLVMEPGAATRFVTRELQECGYRIINVWSTIDGLLLIPNMKPDLVIVANVTAELRGVDFACAIKAMPSTKEVPVAVLSSSSRDDKSLKDLPGEIPLLQKGARFADDVTEVFGQLGIL